MGAAVGPEGGCAIDVGLDVFGRVLRVGGGRGDRADGERGENGADGYLLGQRQASVHPSGRGDKMAAVDEGQILELVKANGLDRALTLIRQLQAQVPLRGVGSPEGVVTAPKGKQYIDDAGGAGTTFYIKETPTGNTGWAAK